MQEGRGHEEGNARKHADRRSKDGRTKEGKECEKARKKGREEIMVTRRKKNQGRTAGTARLETGKEILEKETCCRVGRPMGTSFASVCCKRHGIGGSFFIK
jgi:hypothetical protein